jgi:hypothetical protein
MLLARTHTLWHPPTHTLTLTLLLLMQSIWQYQYGRKNPCKDICLHKLDRLCRMKEMIEGEDEKFHFEIKRKSVSDVWDSCRRTGRKIDDGCFHVNPRKVLWFDVDFVFSSSPFLLIYWSKSMLILFSSSSRWWQFERCIEASTLTKKIVQRCRQGSQS